MLPEADQLLEDVYSLINGIGGDHDRIQVARSCKLAAEYRLNQIKAQRTARAIERRKSERKALLDSVQRAAQDAAAADAVASE